jgi:hypothetical protein
MMKRSRHSSTLQERVPAVIRVSAGGVANGDLVKSATKATFCYHHRLENRTEPKTALQWIRYIVVAAIALVLVWICCAFMSFEPRCDAMIPPCNPRS